LATLLLMTGGGTGSIAVLRSNDGCGCCPSTTDAATGAVSYVFNTGEVWIVNTWLNLTQGQLPIEESWFTGGLTACASFLENLQVAGPYKWVAGMEGIKDRYLRIPNRYDTSWGPCLEDLVEFQGEYHKGGDAGDILRPFFESIFEVCGVERRPLPR